MYVLDNPVLQRELLANLRMSRAFVLLLLYVSLLGSIVLVAWPQSERLDLTQAPQEARQLVDLFFIGQFLLAGMMTPSFAAGAISGEKERKTYEMLLASPLKPLAIVLGKLLASLTHLAALVVASLPIAMLCLPLGGVHPYEVFAAYLGLLVSIVTFGAISLACSSLFHRTASALVVSYLLILPLAILAVLFWRFAATSGFTRLILSVTLFPAACSVLTAMLLAFTSARLLHPPDVGSEGKAVVDLEQEAREAVGLVIQRDQFPDRLFAPPKRNDLMKDNANPVYEKELRSEIFSHGTLMLRLVIQASMLLALPLMAVCLFIIPSLAPWYVSYVLLFNMLVGPVFSAGSITSERERQTLDLLLTTTLTHRQILMGKLWVPLRISAVLTSFVVLPIVLAGALEPEYWTFDNALMLAASVVTIFLTCGLTTSIALFCSSVFRRSSVSLIASYLMIIILFLAPMAVETVAESVTNDSVSVDQVQEFTWTSPFAVVFSLPFQVEVSESVEDFVGKQVDSNEGTWRLFFGYVGFAVVMLLSLPMIILVMLRRRNLNVQ